MENSAKQVLKENKENVLNTKHNFYYDKKVVNSNQIAVARKREKMENFVDNLTDNQKQQALKLIQYANAKNNYEDYLKLVYPDFKMTRFHKYLANLCQTIVHRVEIANKENATNEDKKRGRLKVLISVPPQHGKTATITNTLPSWYVGRNPTRSAILTAYNAEMGEKFNDANRKKIREFGKEVFGVTISDSQDNKGLFELTSGGSIMGVGIQGGITGNGGDIIVVDDPYKNGLEANSPATRKIIEDMFRDSVLTRLRGKGNALIVIHTRWHEADLIGTYCKQDGWLYINIPCICENEKKDPLHRKKGETLCPELGFDAQKIAEIRKNIGEKLFQALYQGHPFIDGGEIFTRKMINFYTKATLPENFDEVVMSCDLSFGGTKKSNDPCAIQVWGRVGANHYLLKRIKKRLTFNEMCDTIKIVSASFPTCRRKIVEKKANGQAIIDSLNNVVGGFEPYDPKMNDKQSRANSVTPYLESGNVWLPDKTLDPTIDEMVDEMMKFPNGEHDDEVDAMTQYLVSYSYHCNGRVDTDNRFSAFAKAIRGY